MIQMLQQQHVVTGPCYWELEWRAELHPAVTDRGTRRSGEQQLHGPCVSLWMGQRTSSGSGLVCCCCLSFYTVSADTLTFSTPSAPHSATST
ncbi:hypothetical protein Q5P01_004402 [Channa striata]|uniref:Uncharacterized protein n=1 Tax=Channa striata TaxID=64152 RepID=A0AA88NL97_CHASR|nr:hypothetical protein Q5P01_004402 [Channa striata]